MGVFHRSKIPMTHTFLYMWVYSGLSEWMYLAQIPCGNYPTDSFGKHLKFPPVSAAILSIKVRAHASFRRLEIMWAVLMSVTFWPCHTYQNKLLVLLSLLISCFILGRKDRMNTCVISSCLFASQFAERWLAGDAHAERFVPHDWCRCLLLEHCHAALVKWLAIVFS